MRQSIQIQRAAATQAEIAAPIAADSATLKGTIQRREIIRGNAEAAGRAAQRRASEIQHRTGIHDHRTLVRGERKAATRRIARDVVKGFIDASSVDVGAAAKREVAAGGSKADSTRQRIHARAQGKRAATERQRPAQIIVGQRSTATVGAVDGEASRRGQRGIGATFGQQDRCVEADIGSAEIHATVALAGDALAGIGGYAGKALYDTVASGEIQLVRAERQLARARCRRNGSRADGIA